jgi:putative spermidine/putrescine transport system permease protein
VTRLDKRCDLGETLTRVALTSYVSLIFAFLLAPLAIVVVMAFSDQPYLSFPPSGWTLGWFHSVLTDSRWLRATANTVRIGVPATVLSTIFGTMAALALAHSTGGQRRLLTLLVLTPMILPTIILAIGLYPTIVGLGLADSYTAVVVGHTVIGIPLVFITVSATLKNCPQSLTLAARTLGAGPWTTFYRVTLPMTWMGIVSGSIFAFAASFDELILSLFLTTPRTETLPIVIWNQLSYALTPALAAASTLILAVTVVIFGAVFALGRWGT